MTVRIQIGGVTIQRIVEQEGPFFEMLKFFPALTKEVLEENRAWLQPRFMSPKDELMLCIQSYLVQTPHHNILIDTCVGNDKPRPARPFWNMMKSDRHNSGYALRFPRIVRLRPDKLPEDADTIERAREIYEKQS